MSIEFHQRLDVEYGKPIPIAPNLKCLTAKNRGPYTYTGTGTFIIGEKKVAIIDPGPLLESHIEDLLSFLENKTLTHILITHTHIDHSPAAKPLAQETGAPIFAFGPHGIGIGAGLEEEEVEEGADKEFIPTKTLKDGETISGEGWSLKAIHTPGHTSNHMCFHWLEENIIFTGDHIMGWSTSVISPPDGDMGAYMKSLEKIKNIGAKALHPTHGPAIPNPNEFISSLIFHRLEREDQILKTVQKGHQGLREITEIVYSHIGPELIMAAERNTLSHLLYLVEQGKIDANSF